MTIETLIIAQFLFLVLSIGLCMLIRDPAWILRIPVFSSFLVLLITGFIVLQFFTSGTCILFGGSFLLDSLSLYHIVLVNIVFFVTGIYATGYFKHQRESGNLTVAYARRYSMLWQAFQSLLLIVLLSNNIGLMWIAIEATTLVSAFLIISENESLSIEAMWKYLLICSVGIVFAFMGTILTVAAARNLHTGAGGYLFSELIQHPNLIDPKLMLLAFILISVGFGTKAGLSPMHTWLPDAHSQAPTPVSAVFSGVMLNCALFCIMRYLPITEAALGNDGQAHSILLLFGLVSLIFSAVFIPIQHDMKRFLAYCSVEHIGIIAVGLGLGGLGTFAALLHTTNHSLSKILAFFSAGHISELYGTRDMRRIGATVRNMPWWGSAFFISVLVLIGVAPFSVFMSEFLIVKEAFFTGRYFVFGLFIFATLTVFISALKHALNVSFGKSSSSDIVHENTRLADKVIIILCLLVLLILGFWIPSPFADFLRSAATIVEQGVKL